MHPETTAKYHIQPNRPSPVKKEYQWILNSTRSKMMAPNNVNPNVGPGSYSSETYKKGSSSQLRSWGKEERFERRERKFTSLLGPGSYESSQEISASPHNKGVQSVFKSKTPKISFLKRLGVMKNTEEQPVFASALNEELPLKLKSQRREKEPSLFFASKVPRFLTEGNVEDAVGPGSYELRGDARNQPK